MRLETCIRDKWITILLLCALALSFFITLNGLELYASFQEEKNAKAEEKYKTEYQWRQENLESWESKEVDTYLHLEKLNLKSGNLSLYTGITSVANSTRIIGGYYYCCLNEELKRQFVWGSLSDQKQTVVINDILEEYTYQRGKHRYIVLEQEEYMVTGVVRSYSGETEGEFYTCYSSITPKLKKILQDNILQNGCYFYLSYVTDNNISVTDLKTVSDWCKDYVSEYQLSFVDVSLQPVEEIGRNTKMFFWFLLILLIFALTNSTVIIHTWMSRRKKEMLIRKTYGQSNLQIAKKVYGEICVHAVICVILVLFGNSIYHVVTKRDYPEQYGFVVLMLVISALVISFLIILIPMIRLYKLKPGEALKEE